jgi:hypothetical protein
MNGCTFGRMKQSQVDTLKKALETAKDAEVDARKDVTNAVEAKTRCLSTALHHQWICLPRALPCTAPCADTGSPSAVPWQSTKGSFDPCTTANCSCYSLSLTVLRVVQRGVGDEEHAGRRADEADRSRRDRCFARATHALPHCCYQHFCCYRRALPLLPSFTLLLSLTAIDIHSLQRLERRHATSTN